MHRRARLHSTFVDPEVLTQIAKDDVAHSAQRSSLLYFQYRAIVERGVWLPTQSTSRHVDRNAPRANRDAHRVQLGNDVLVDQPERIPPAA